jgi:hypothetical protein
MNQSELLAKLKSEFSEMENLANSFEEVAFFKQPHAEKWSVAQNIVHLNFVAKSILGGIKDPSVLAANGVATRPSRDFDAVREAYLTGLIAYKAKGMPYRHLNTEGPKVNLINEFNTLHEKLVTQSATLSEADWDELQLPHPVLGLMTLREMMCFATYHIRHHYNIVEKINI